MYKNNIEKGQKINNFIILEILNEKANGSFICLCECDCGNIVKIRKNNLISGYSKKCKKCHLKNIHKLRSKDV